MGDDDGFVCCGADDFEDSQGGRRETDILFEVPEVFVAVAFDVELFEQSGFEFVDGAGVGVANIEEDDFRRGFDSCLGIDEGSSAVDDADAVEGFDSGEGGGVAGLSEAVERRVKDFAVWPSRSRTEPSVVKSGPTMMERSTASRYDWQVKKPSSTAPMPPILFAASCVM